MPRRVKPLTDTECRNAKYLENGGNRLFDGGGLYLELVRSGSKIWRLKYRRPTGQENRLSLGPYPQVSITQARQKRDANKEIIREGKDPAFEHEKNRAQATLMAKNTFEIVAREWHDNFKEGWVPRHAQNILNRLEQDIFPAIGHLPITAIDNPTVLEAVRAIAVPIAHAMPSF